MTKVFLLKLGRRQLVFRSEQVIFAHNAKKADKILNGPKEFSDVTLKTVNIENTLKRTCRIQWSKQRGNQNLREIKPIISYTVNEPANTDWNLCLKYKMYFSLNISISMWFYAQSCSTSIHFTLAHWRSDGYEHLSVFNKPLA